MLSIQALISFQSFKADRLLGLIFLPLVLASTAGGLWIGNRIPKARLRQVAMGLLFVIAAVSIS